MKREIIVTADGSTTIHIPEWNEQYHSKHGAIQEAYHVFIKHGLFYICPPELNPESHQNISILEIGFGTGLNAFISLLEAEKLKQHIDYVGIEAYPVLGNELSKLNYTTALQAEDGEVVFKKIHGAIWEEKQAITDYFSLTKRKRLFSEIEDESLYNLIYFDAFGARVQPELWTEAIFQRMFRALKPKGLLVTYSAKGSVRRAMQSVGFSVEKLPGLPENAKCYVLVKQGNY